MRTLPQLILAATTLGNPKDIPERSLEALRQSDLLLFESHRNARLFLKAAGIHREYMQYSEHREPEALEAFEQALKQKQTVVFMSDQGTPTFADPGRQLLKKAYQFGAQVRVIPGPSALSAALSACPFEIENFYYAGFLPQKKEARAEALKQLARKKEPLILFDTPYRRQNLLRECTERFPKRTAFLALDISGPEENFLVGTCLALSKGTEKLPKLNFVLILSRMPSHP